MPKLLPGYLATVVILCDAQSTLHLNGISIIHAKFHLVEKIKTPFMVNFFMYFLSFYIIIDQKLGVMNIQRLIAQACKKHYYTHLSFLDILTKGCNIHPMNKSTRQCYLSKKIKKLYLNYILVIFAFKYYTFRAASSCLCQIIN
jgi:K+-transporting ATPase A subunit